MHSSTMRTKSPEQMSWHRRRFSSTGHAAKITNIASRSPRRSAVVEGPSWEWLSANAKFPAFDSAYRICDCSGGGSVDPRLADLSNRRRNRCTGDSRSGDSTLEYLLHEPPCQLAAVCPRPNRGGGSELLRCGLGHKDRRPCTISSELSIYSAVSRFLVEVGDPASGRISRLRNLFNLGAVQRVLFDPARRFARASIRGDSPVPGVLRDSCGGQ